MINSHLGRSWLILITSALVACGGGGGGGGDDAPPPVVTAPPAPPVEQVIRQSLTIPALSTFSANDNNLVSPNITVTIPANTISFALYLNGSQAGFTNDGNSLLQLFMGNLFDPNNSSVLAVENRFQSCSLGYCALLVPKGDGINPITGSYRLVLAVNPDNINHASSLNADNTLSLVIRTGIAPSATQSTIRIQPFLTGTTTTPTELTPALDRIVSLFSQNNLIADIQDVILVPDPALATVSVDFDDPTTRQLFGMGVIDAVNIFFVESVNDFGGMGLALLGQAAGIPGSLGIQGNRNGLMVNIETHIGMINGLNTDQLGATAAHETGHLLGLFHTSEQVDDMANDPPGEQVFDILADTPQCAVNTFDGSANGTNNQRISADECPDGSNIMFFSPGTTSETIPFFEQNVLSSSQQRIIRSAPIVTNPQAN